MERLKFFGIYVFMVTFFLYPSISILFFDKTNLTSTDFVLVLIFFFIGLGLIAMGIMRAVELLRKK